MHRLWPVALFSATRTLRYQSRWLAIVFTSAFGMVAGMEFMYTPLSIAPPSSCIPQTARLLGKSGDKKQENKVFNLCANGADFALYADSNQQGTVVQPYESLSQQLQAQEVRLENQSFFVYGDTNRDGKVDDADYAGHQTWSWKSGAFMLFNNDDDDGKGGPDWQDNVVNSTLDEADLAKVELHIGKEFVGDKFVLVADDNSRPYINVFQKNERGWVPVQADGTQSIGFNQKIVLGVEAKQFANRNWNGLLTLKAVAKDGDKVVAEDRVQLRVAPWIMLPNTAPVKELYVSDVGMANREFVSQIKTAAEAAGAKVKVIPGGTAWNQDTMEIGYVQFPEESKLRSYNVVLNGLRGSDLDLFPRSLLSRDTGWFQVGQLRRLDALNQWTDWFGNLEVSPPLPGYPMGRIYYGNAGTVAFHPEVLDFLKAQEVQGPPVDLDTSWLAIRHVDEIISFIPSPSGKPLLMVVSPKEGVNILKELQKKGYGNQLVNRGLSTQSTVNAALSNSNFIEYNLKLQTEKIDPLVAKLKREFRLSDDQVIPIPSMFVFGGSSWWPNMVNSVVVNGRLMASSPRGVVIDGKDYTQEAFRRRVARSGLTVYFLDDRYYQELRGNTHCATNTRRKEFDRPFWLLLPDWIGNR